MYIYMDIHLRINICIFPYIYVFTDECTIVSIYINMYIQIHILYICILIHICIVIYMYIHIYIHIQMYKCIHIDVHIYVYTHVYIYKRIHTWRDYLHFRDLTFPPALCFLWEKKNFVPKINTFREWFENFGRGDRTAETRKYFGILENILVHILENILVHGS